MNITIFIGDGEQSCYDTTIVVQSLDGDVECNGLRSCAKSDIAVSHDTYLYGALSAQNSTIRPNNTIYLYGYNAINGGQVICEQSI